MTEHRITVSDQLAINRKEIRKAVGRVRAGQVVWRDYIRLLWSRHKYLHWKLKHLP